MGTGPCDPGTPNCVNGPTVWADPGCANYDPQGFSTGGIECQLERDQCEASGGSWSWSDGSCTEFADVGNDPAGSDNSSGGLGDADAGPYGATNLGQQGPSCLPQLGFALLSTALDLTLFLGPEARLIFTGAGELAMGGLARGAAVVGRAGGDLSKAAAGRLIAGGIDMARNGKAAMALGTAQLPAALATGAELDVGSQALNPEVSKLSWQDFIPVVGTVRAWEAWGTCRAGGE
jgi:hypothetical protein